MNRVTSGKILPLLFALTILIAGMSPGLSDIMHRAPSSIGTGRAGVFLAEGSDGEEAGLSIDADSNHAVFKGMAGWPNATRFYEDSIRIRNDDQTTGTVELMFDSWSGSVTKLTVSVRVFDANGRQKGYTIHVGESGSSTGPIMMMSRETCRVQWELKWTAEATTADKATILLRLSTKVE